MHRVLVAAAAIAICVASGSTPAGAEEVKAEVDAVLRRDRMSSSPPVATVRQGETLPVVKRDGKWILGTAEGKQGWVPSERLKAPRGGIASAARSAEVVVSGGAQSQSAQDAAAAKGVSPTAIQYASGKGYDTSGLDRLTRLRAEVIDSGQFEQFSREGNVGPFRQ